MGKIPEVKKKLSPQAKHQQNIQRAAAILNSFAKNSIVQLSCQKIFERQR